MPVVQVTFTPELRQQMEMFSTNIQALVNKFSSQPTFTLDTDALQTTVSAFFVTLFTELNAQIAPAV